MRIIILTILLVFATSAAFADQLTGCLHVRKGKLYRVAVGDAPRKPCSSSQVEVRFGSAPDSDIQDQLDAIKARLAALEPLPPTDGLTCRDILNADPDVPTAVYLLGTPDNPFEGYCDMETDGGGWLIAFHGSDPSIWGTDTGLPGAVQWSHNMRQHDLNMNTVEIMIRHTGTGQHQKIGSIAYEEIYLCVQGEPISNNQRWWNGANTFADGGFHLGIHTEDSVSDPGFVVVNRCLTNARRGWGFGHIRDVNTAQGWGWNSLDMGPTVFQIGIR